MTDGDALIDISVAYGAATPEWPGDTPYACGWAWDMAQGASVTIGRVVTSWHVGTHADAPRHVALGGATSEALPLAAFEGPALVLDVRAAANEAVLDRAAVLTALGDNAVPHRLLLRTGRSVATGRFPAAWPTLAPDAAAWLVSRGLHLLGTDAPSVDAREAKVLAVHHALFGGGAWVLENLALDAAPAGAYWLLAHPVLVAGADAAPVRATLRPLPAAPPR